MRIFSIVILLILTLTACQTHDISHRAEKTTDVQATKANGNTTTAENKPSGRGSLKNPSVTLDASKNLLNQDLPQSLNANSTELILDHGYFQVSYSEKNRLPNWVSYHLRADNLKNKVAKRRNKFFADPQLVQIKKAFATPSDFDGDTYDRGHMAPSDDFAWDQKANDATFVMTNMAPQERALNRGSWKKLELSIRKWACTEGELRVVTGPILSGPMLRMSSQVPVPQKFFKVVLDETRPRKAIGFIYKQEDGKASMAAQAMNLASIEKQTGYKFFVDIAQDERKSLEIAYNLQDWVETDCLPGRKKHR
jgi:endonuclease G